MVNLDENKIYQMKEKYKSLYFPASNDNSQEVGVHYEEIKLMYDEVEKVIQEVSKFNSKALQREKINKSGVIRKLCSAVDLATAKTDDIEELKFLQKFITPKMREYDQLFANSSYDKINRKIHEVEQKKVIANLSTASKVALKIAKSISDGSLDENIVTTMIDEEAKRNATNKSNNKFSLTEEQEKSKILSQVKAALKEGKYPIKDSERALEQIQTICKSDLNLAINIVIKNLIASKKFDEAKSLLQSYLTKYNSPQSSQTLRILEIELRYAEIGNMVLKGINMKAVPQKQLEYFNLIEKGIEKGNVNIEKVSLGKNKDGSKDIMLSDIWPDYEKEQRRR